MVRVAGSGQESAKGTSRRRRLCCGGAGARGAGQDLCEVYTHSLHSVDARPWRALRCLCGVASAPLMARSVGAAGSPRALLIAALFLLHHLASPAAAQTVISDCKPDFLEPNDDFQNSTYVALPVMAPALTLCPAGDRDFFRFRLTNATELTFAISCDTPELKVRTHALRAPDLRVLGL